MSCSNKHKISLRAIFSLGKHLDKSEILTCRQTYKQQTITIALATIVKGFSILKSAIFSVLMSFDLLWEIKTFPNDIKKTPLEQSLC